MAMTRTMTPRSFKTSRTHRRRSGTPLSSKFNLSPALTLHTPHERLQAAATQVHLLRASIQRHIHLWYSPSSHSQSNQVAPQSNHSSDVTSLLQEIEAIANASWSSSSNPISAAPAAEQPDVELMDQLLTQLEFLKRITATLDDIMDLDRLAAHGTQIDKAAQLAASLGQQVHALAAQSQDLGHCLDPAVFPFLLETIAMHANLIQDRVEELSSRFFAFTTDASSRKSSTTRKLTITYEIPLDPPPPAAATAAFANPSALPFDPPEPVLNPIALSTVMDALAHLNMLDTHLSTLIDRLFTHLIDPLLDPAHFHRVQWHSETLSAFVRVHSDVPGGGAGTDPWQPPLDNMARVLQGVAALLQHRGLLDCIDTVWPVVHARVSSQLAPLVIDCVLLAHVPDDAHAVPGFATRVAEGLVGFRDRVAETGLVADAALDEICAGVQLAQAVHVRRRRGGLVLAATEVLCSRDANVVKVVENTDLVHFKNAGIASKGQAARGAAAGAGAGGGGGGEGVVIRGTTSRVPNADPAAAVPGSGGGGKRGGKHGADSGDLLGIDLTHWDTFSSLSSSSSPSTPLMDFSLARLPNYLVTTQTHALLEMMTDLVQRHAAHPTWDNERDAPAALEAYEQVHDLVLLWMAVVPALRGHSLRTSPRAAALFRNDAECLLHHLVTLPAKARCGIPRQWMPPATLMDLAPGVVRAGNAVFKDMMVTLHTQFQAHVDALGDLNDLHLDSAFDQAQAAVQDMLDHLDRLDQAWKHCLPDDLYLRALGSLLDTYFARLVARILDTLTPHISKRNSHVLRFILIQALHVEPYFTLSLGGIRAAPSPGRVGVSRAGGGGGGTRQPQLAVSPHVARHCPAYVKVVDVARLLSALSLVQGRSDAERVSGLGREEALSLVERRVY